MIKMISGNKLAYVLSIGVLLTAFILNPFGSNIFELPKLQWATLVLSIAVIFIVVKFLREKSLELRYDKFVLVLLCAWLLSLILSTVFSIAPKLSFWGSYDRMQGLYSYIVYLSFFVLFIQYFTTLERQKIFLKSLTIVGIIIGIHALLQQVGILTFSDEAMEEFLGRSFSTFGHPNFLGQFLIFPIWSSAYLLSEKNLYWKIVSSVGLILLVAALLVTENRASILGVAMGFIFWLISFSRLKVYFKYILSFLTLGTILIFVIFFASSLRSLTTRIFLWTGSFDIFLDHPIVGSGLETFKLVFQKVAASELFQLEKIYSIADRAHNEYIDILVAQGLFGLVVYLVIIFGIIFLVLKYKKHSKENLAFFLTAGFVSVLVSNFFSFSLVVHQLIFVVFVAIILNCVVRFKIFKLHRTFLSVFFAGVITTLSFVTIFHAGKTIYADNQFKTGMDKIYDARINEGIDQIVSALRLNPYQEDIYFHLADVLFVIGKELNMPDAFWQAKILVEEAGKFTGNDFRYNFTIARLETYLGNYTEAEKFYDAATGLAPINPIIMKEKGVMFYLKGDYVSATMEIEKFLSMIPDSWKYKSNLDNLSYEEKEKFRLFTKHLPDLWDMFAYLSRSYIEVGDRKKAEYYLQFVKGEETIEKLQKMLEEKL